MYVTYIFVLCVDANAAYFNDTNEGYVIRRI